MNQLKNSRVKLTTTFKQVMGDSGLLFIILPAITIGGQNCKYHIECSIAFLWGKWSCIFTLYIPKIMSTITRERK